MELIRYKTGMEFHGGKYCMSIFLICLLNSCVVDKMDCRLRIDNQLQHDIYIGVTTKNDPFEKERFIKTFNIILKESRSYPKQVEISKTKKNCKEFFCLDPSETVEANKLYLYLFDVNSLIKNFDENLNPEHFNDYHVLYYTIDHMDSINWEIALDSLQLKKASPFHGNSKF
jgi:hypothetical protein